MNNQRSLEPLRGNKILVIIAMAFMLVGTLGITSANEDLQIWRNSTTGANVTTVDNNGNWNILGNIDFFGIISGDGSGLTGILGSQITNDLNWINSATLYETDSLWTNRLSRFIY